MKFMLNKINYKSIICFVLLLILLFPLIQKKIKIIEFKPLKGFINSIDTVKFCDSTWFNLSYQEYQEQKITKDFGGREIIIRIANQFDFSLYKKLNAYGIIRGKGNYLFELPYITSYLGEDFLGKEKLNEYTDKIKAIQDTLEKQNKTKHF